MHLEKEELPPVSFACGHSVCGQCQRRRRRLGQACVLCATSDVLFPSSATPATSSRSSPKPPAYPSSPPDGAADFVLGGDSDDEDDVKREDSPPLAEGWDAPPAYEDNAAQLVTDEKRHREQPSLHYIKPEDTLAGLALRYAVPGHVLCTLNRLPISTLSTTPHLLHTLPFLLLPPGSRPSTSSEPLLSQPDERRRLIVRRFQMASKCADWAMAQAYVDQVFKAREEEARFVAENRRARGEADVEVEPREGGELEEAVDAFQRDERWEKEQQALGKGKRAMGSKLRSTGQVEQKVRRRWVF
ncbi:hypothetical protein JCM10213v2_002407 [Rhodosporidiobolus nylandii]